MGMDPSTFREKSAMMTGRAAKGPRNRERTKELTNQKVSASLPMRQLTRGAAPLFSLQSVFFMADLLFLSRGRGIISGPALLQGKRKECAAEGARDPKAKSADNFFQTKTNTCKL
jgi:hypothetical protein